MDAILLEQLVTELMEEDKIRCRRLRSPVPLDVSDLRSPGLHCVFLFRKGYLGMPDMNDGETETDAAPLYRKNVNDAGSLSLASVGLFQERKCWIDGRA